MAFDTSTGTFTTDLGILSVRKPWSDDLAALAPMVQYAALKTCSILLASLCQSLSSS
jgi:hypothetical protein